MPNIDEILRMLAEYGIPTSGVAIPNSVDPSGVRLAYVFVPVHRDAQNLQRPSNQSMAHAKAAISDKGFELDFILTDGDKRDAEAGLRATLLHGFGDYIRNAFLSTHNQRATVWLDLKRGLEAPVADAINVKTRIFLNDVGLTLSDISSTDAENLPTNTALLSVLRRLAPIAQDGLRRALEAAGFTIPSDDWLSRRLDLLRKHGSLVRTQSAQFVLSISTLRQLGSAKNASSPDVKRLLEMATRGK